MSFNVNVVLVRSKYASNIGSSARAAANMNADRLILIDPKTDINSKAKQGAAGAQSYLEERTSYQNWDEFYQSEGSGIRIGMTRREGRVRQTEDLETTLKQLHELHDDFLQKPIYLVFGPEDHGLDSQDLALMNRNCYLPIDGQFKSINLSHAVLLTLYITCSFLKTHQKTSETAPHNQTPELAPFTFPEDLIKEWLETMGLDLSAQRTNVYTVLRDLFLLSSPNPQSLKILEKVLQQNLRLLRRKDLEPKPRV